MDLNGPKFKCVNNPNFDVLRIEVNNADSVDVMPDTFVDAF